MNWYSDLKSVQVSHTDLVRLWVIVSLTLCCILITAVSLTRYTESIVAQLFYFPILYTTYFYPKKGVYLAGACALVYEILAYIALYPDTAGLIYTTGQAIMFVLVAVVVAYFTDKVNASETRYRSIFETSLLGIVLFDQNSFSIRFMNTQAETMLGYSAEELHQSRFSRLFFSEDEQKRFFERLGSSEEISNFETRFLTKAGHPFWVNLSWRRVADNMVSCSIIDIDSRKHAEKTAEENYAQYEQVTEHSPTGIVIIRDSAIAYANPAFCGFSGYPSDELDGKDLASFIHPDDLDKYRRFVPSGETPLPESDMMECRFVTKGGGTRLAALFAAPITRRGVPAVLINLVDITERELLKKRIRLDTERRQGLISTVASELSTPLQPIIGYLNMLIEDPKAYGVTEETRVILDRVAKSVDHERQIINQMLELSVLDEGKIPLEYTGFSVPELIRSLIESGNYVANADITLDIPRDLMFEADRNKLSIVMDALLSNAVAYSKPPRKIRVMYRSTPGDTMHRLAIQDNGIGITSARLDEIFKPFDGEVTGGPVRKHEQVGLSLSIARKYVQMHGGYISVDSIVNLGSTFTVHIPKQRPADELE